MRKILFLLILLCIPVHAAEESANLSWDQPTTFEDGTPLDSVLIAGYRLYYSIDTLVAGTETPVIIAPGTNHTFTITLTPRPEPYVLNFAIRVYLTDGRESVLSNVASKSVIAKSDANPAPPTNLQFTIDCGAMPCTIEVQP